jgi:hypothetical protein
MDGPVEGAMEEDKDDESLSSMALPSLAILIAMRLMGVALRDGEEDKEPAVSGALDGPECELGVLSGSMGGGGGAACRRCRDAAPEARALLCWCLFECRRAIPDRPRDIAPLLSPPDSLVLCEEDGAADEDVGGISTGGGMTTASWDSKAAVKVCSCCLNITLSPLAQRFI